MFDQELYVREKLNTLKRSPLQRTIPATHEAPGAFAAPILRYAGRALWRKPVYAPLARSAGRALHRWGHSLESWGCPDPAETEAAELRLQRKLS
jgi:hypothetical protein